MHPILLNFFFSLCLQGPPGPTGIQGVIGAPGPAVSSISSQRFFFIYILQILVTVIKRKFILALDKNSFLVAAPALVSLWPEEKLNDSLLRVISL